MTFIVRMTKLEKLTVGYDYSEDHLILKTNQPSLYRAVVGLHLEDDISILLEGYQCPVKRSKTGNKKSFTPQTIANCCMSYTSQY